MLRPEVTAPVMLVVNKSAQPRRVDVYADRGRRLAVLDPVGRELMISVGAAVFTARVALRRRGRIDRKPELAGGLLAGTHIQG